MRKRTYFDTRHSDGWPDFEWLAPYFLTSAGQRRAFGAMESWGLKIDGLDGTEHLKPFKDRVDLDLTIQGHTEHGILLFYQIAGGGRSEAKYSKGDQTKWRQWIETPQGDYMSLALFIPFETAWKTIKEFIESEGALPRSIEWIDSSDLPNFAFRPELAG